MTAISTQPARVRMTLEPVTYERPKVHEHRNNKQYTVSRGTSKSRKKNCDERQRLAAYSDIPLRGRRLLLLLLLGLLTLVFALGCLIGNLFQIPVNSAYHKRIIMNMNIL